jgi:hypothetical protein
MATREEVKAACKAVISGSFGLFFRVSALNSTGASIKFTAAHDLYCLDHFLPLLPTSYA